MRADVPIHHLSFRRVVFPFRKRIYIYIFLPFPRVFLPSSFISSFLPPLFSLFSLLFRDESVNSKGSEHAFNFRINSRSPAAFILPEIGRTNSAWQKARKLLRYDPVEKGDALKGTGLAKIRSSKIAEINNRE